MFITQTCYVLLFPVDSNTHDFFCRLQRKVLDAASLFQTGHVIHLKQTDWFAASKTLLLKAGKKLVRVAVYWEE